jgi:hypothetical protein
VQGPGSNTPTQQQQQQQQKEREKEIWHRENNMVALQIDVESTCVY